MKISACSDVGLVRSSNEDNYCALDLSPDWPGWLLAVADGMGGHEDGEEASASAIMALQDYVRKAIESVRPINPDHILSAAVHEADRVVTREAQTRGGSTMGTTLTAFLAGGGWLFWGHVGDSRAYLVSSEGQMQLTRDHSLVGELVREGSLTEEEAVTHPQRNILTSALGGGIKELDIGEQPYREGDILVLCTDGLYNLVSGAEIGGIARQAAAGEDFSSVAQQLAKLANDRGGSDNITALVVILS